MVLDLRDLGEANAIALRLARAASGRDCVAVCGYHGWHDWYLSANLGEKSNLDGHLLPGLSTKGVPKALRNIVHPFNYNDFDSLKKIVDQYQVGVVKMEVMRNRGPENGFLSKIQDLCNERGIVLVFDECTSGFREAYGGLHKKFGVDPDLVVFGKTLGNGYAVSAVVGKDSVMQCAQSTFISSTFWTERIGSVAGLKTLQLMEERQPWDYITQKGKEILEIWTELAKANNLRIEIRSGLPALSTFSFVSKNSLEYKTLITQEMLNGFSCWHRNLRMYRTYI